MLVLGSIDCGSGCRERRRVIYSCHVHRVGSSCGRVTDSVLDLEGEGGVGRAVGVGCPDETEVGNRAYGNLLVQRDVLARVVGVVVVSVDEQRSSRLQCGNLDVAD